MCLEIFKDLRSAIHVNECGDTVHWDMLHETCICFSEVHMLIYILMSGARYHGVLSMMPLILINVLHYCEWAVP